MTRVVVAGGTGFLGRTLVGRLIEAGHAVTVLARDPDAAKRHLGEGLAYRAWTLEAGSAREAWEREVSAAGAVVNLAGAAVMDVAWSAARKAELRRSRIDVTSALALVMARATWSAADGARVLVSASAVGIYGGRSDGTLLTEDVPPGSDFLAALCVAWEAAAEPARAAGIRVVHPRLGIVLGREGGALAALVRPFKLGLGGPIGHGDQWVSWVHEQDVAVGLLLALSSPLMHGAYNFVAPTPVTMEEEAVAIAEVLRTRAQARVPAFVLRVALGRDRADAILTGQRASAERLVQAGLDFSFPEIRPALRDLLGTA